MNDKNLSVKIPLEIRGIFAGHFKFGGQHRTLKTQILRTKTQHLFERLNSFFHLVAMFAVTIIHNYKACRHMWRLATRLGNANIN